MMLVRRSFIAFLATSLIKESHCEDVYTTKYSREGSKYQELMPPIANPQSPENKYSIIRLKNNLSAVILSTPTATDSVAALAVKVGSQSDPKAIPGLAHYYEHMVFMGSTKYPDSTEYLSYMASHSGKPNALTMYDMTRYVVQVSDPGFEGALDRFSSAIEAPLFSEDTIVSEARNVNNEFNNEYTSVQAQLTQVKRVTGDPNHPYSNEFIGSYESLVARPRSQGIDIRQELIKFKDSYYSANIMYLAVVSSKPIDELKELVVLKFSGIPDRDIPVPTYPGSPFRPQDKGVIINAVTDSEENLLDIQFDLPSQQIYYKELPIRYIRHVLEGEGPNSLKSILATKGWVTELYFGPDANYHDFYEFTLHLNLTPLGIGHRKDILKLLFQAISVIKNHGVTQERFDELRSIGEMTVKYRETKGSLANMFQLSDAMVESRFMSSVLNYSDYPRVYNETLIKEFLSFIKPRNMRVSFMSKSNAGLPGLKSEPWYGTKFNVVPLPEDLITEIEETLNNQYGTTDSPFRLPKLNHFMPKSFDIISQDSPPGYPKLIKTSTSGQLWYGVDGKSTPKATIKINYNYQPKDIVPSLYHAQLKVIRKVLQVESADFISEVGNAGVTTYFSVDHTGLNIHAYGFSQRLVEITKLVIDKLQSIEFSEKTVNLSKEQLINDNLSQKRSSLEGEFERLLKVVLVKEEEEEESESHFPEITAQDLQQTTRQLLSESFVTVFTSGNIGRDASENIAAYAQTDSTRPEFQPPPNQPIILPDGSNFVVKYFDQYAELKNSYTGVFFDLGSEANYQSVAYAYFISDIMSPAVFNQLRTKESLGYYVRSNVVKVGDRFGITVTVEGEARDPIYVESRINAFLERFIQQIEKLASKEFQNQLDSFISKHKTMYADTGKLNTYLWNAILSKQSDFSMKDKVVEELQQLNKSTVLEILNSTFREGSPKRRKVSFHLVAKRADPAYMNSSKNPDMNPGVYIDNISRWKSETILGQV